MSKAKRMANVTLGSLAKVFTSDPMKLAGWAAAGLSSYAASIHIGTDNPQLQQALWKLGHVTMYAWLGYWIARGTLGRVDRVSPKDQTLIARAILVGLAMVAGANGL